MATSRPAVRTTRTVAVALSVLLGLAGVAVMPHPRAEAAFATGGAGLNPGLLDWFEWGSTPDQAIPAVGVTETNTRTIAGQTLATTCTLSNITGTGGLMTYASGEWVGDSFDDLYNVGGVGTSNTMVSGLANTVDGDTMDFQVACSGALDGRPVPLAGLVIADAEASNAPQGEYVQATPDQTVTWRIIDRFRGTDCPTSSVATLQADGTMRLSPDGLECDSVNGTPGPGAVGFMQGATSAQIQLKGGGRSAVALGAVLATDLGDAPSSYGAAGSLYDPGWQGGTVPVGSTNVSDAGFALATLGRPVPDWAPSSTGSR